MLGGQTSMFGSLMQQAMQGAKGGGGEQSSGGHGAGGGVGAAGVAGPGPVGAGGQPQQPRDDAGPAVEDRPTEHREEPHYQEREPLQRAETNDRAAAGPTEGGHGPALVHSPEHRRGDEDLGRTM